MVSIVYVLVLFFSEYNIHVSLIISEDIKGPNLAVDFSEVLLGK